MGRIEKSSLLPPPIRPTLSLGKAAFLPKDDYGKDRFPKRTLEAIEVDYPAEEKRIHACQVTLELE